MSTEAWMGLTIATVVMFIVFALGIALGALIF